MRGTMSKPQKFCIYCGGPGLSKEHIFADWLRAYVPRELSEHRAEFTVMFPHKTEKTLERRTGDTHARRLRRVCLACNRGWMSSLQEAAKPYLVPMLEGRQVSLHRRAQKAVAGWIAMTAMTAEYLNEEMVSISQEQRDYLRETSQAPRHWRIWIGKYRRGQGKKRFWHNAMALTREKVQGNALYARAPSNTQTTSICLGDHLFIYAMSSEVAWNLIRRWRFPAGIGPSLRQIYPSAAASAEWPPGRELTFEEVDFVSDQFYNRVVREARKAAVEFPPPL